MFDLIEATAPAVVASFISASNLQNYTITHDIAGGGIKTKYKRNMEAIKLLNQIESEGRVATPEEQRVLVEFVGWGGMPGVFDSKHKMYSPELFETLSESEYVAARRSTLNAHYTSLPVIDFMWSGLKRMGFNFGSVLEPAIGVGHFFGRMPLEMRDKSTLYGLDADGLSVRLAKQLYPLCAIINTKYQKYRSNIQFDVVASNIPFANIKISDPEIFHNGRGYLSGAGLHDYYFIKSLDLLRSGGLLAFITSRYTMDKADSVYRKYIASKSTLLGAVRLPSNAFKKNAHTETTMDILFFIKQPDPDPGWIDVERFNGGTDEQYFVNNYFAANPDHMIGEMKVNNRKFKGAAECVYAGDDFEAELHAKVENFPKDVYEQPVKHRPTKVSTGRTIGMEQSATYVQPKEKTWLREGSFAVDEWFRVWQKQGYAWVQLDYGKKASRTRDLCNLRDAFRLMLKANLDQVSDEEFAVHQNRLNVLYDSFVRSHGFINNRANSMVFKDDPDYYPMLALEKWDDETEKAIKQELFFNKRLDFYGAAATKAANAPDALAITLDQYGWVNFNHMIMLLELDADDESVVNGIVEELGDAIFENPKIDPETNGMHQWVTRDRYLSGNVRQKLEEAKRAGLKRNVVALVKVQPRDLVPREIVVRFGASFVPAKYIMQFVDDHMWKGKDTGLKITYHNGLGKWVLDENDRNRWTVDNSTENTQEWGTPNVSAVTLIEKTLNKQSHTVYESYWDPSDGKEKRKPDQNATLAAQQKQESMKFAWTEWWKKDEKRAADISKIYNEGFNNYIPRQFDGSHLHFEGMNAAIELRSHQTDVVWRILQDPSTLMAHVVGAGKSFAMIAAAMKLKQLGISNKPVILVKKSTFPRILADAYLLYPNANILAAGSMPKNKRMYITGRIALEDWDIIVMTHEVFKSLNLTTETQMGFYREELAAIRLMLEEAKANADEPKKDPTVKQLENKLENIAAKMDDLRARSGKKDNGLFFEELGLDALFYDESQKIKNLYYPTTMSRIPGVGGSSESGIAFDSYMKFRWMDKNKEKPRLVFATGTPVENTLGEMYTLMRYMMYSELEVMGIHHFDAWAGVYGDEVTSVEMTPDGGDFHLKTRFAKFNNVPELLKLFWSFADVRMDRDKMGLDVPEVISGKPMGVTSPSSDVQTAVTAWLINRAANIDPRDKRSDNMLMVVGDARKCALDPRLLGPDKLSKAGIDYEIEDNPDSKVNKCVKNILGLYHNPSEHGLTQVVFLDLFQTDYMHLYHDIIDKLVAGGIKRNEIAIAQEQNTDDQRRKMQEQMQEGKLRVALGSTQTLGIGVNIQNKLIAAHMLDVPWKPAEYEQRMGRIVRQGNLNKEVYVYNYLTEKTFDVFMWETNQRKAKFIAQIFAGNLTVRTLEDIEAAVITYTEMAAMASGNPLVMEKVKVEADLVKYRSLEQQHSDSLGAMISRSHSLTGEIQMQKESLAAWGKLLDVIKQAGPDPLRELALKLYDLCMDVGDTHELVPIGQIYDMEVAYDNRVTVRQSVAKEFGIDTDKLAKSEEFAAALRAGVVENVHEYTKMVIKQKGGGDKAEEVLATAQLVVITGGPRYISFKLMVGRDDHAEKNLAKMENIFGQVAAEKFVASAEENLKESCIRLERYTEAATLPFEHANVLRETEQRYYDIVAELDIAATKSKVPAAGGDAPLPMAA